MYTRFVVLLSTAFVACGVDEAGECPPGEDQQPIVNPGAAVAFNGGFEDRTFPYDGTCSCNGTVIMCSPTPQSTCYCADHDNDPGTPTDVICAAPFEPSTGWTIDPPDLFTLNPVDGKYHPAARGNGGVFFLYRAGRVPGPDRLPGYGPEGTALHFQTCDNSDRWNNVVGPPGPTNDYSSPPDGVPDSDWCYQTAAITVRSPSFSPTPESTYSFAAWVRSSLFMSVGSTHLHGLRIAVLFFDAAGALVGSAALDAPEPAPLPWTRLESTVVVPARSTHAVVEVIQDRNHQSNVYVDDIILTPL